MTMTRHTPCPTTQTPRGRELGSIIRHRRRLTVHRVTAGLEGRYYVRAGLDPAYAAPVNRDRLVMAILDGEAEGTQLLSAGQRRAVAVAAIRGWITGYVR